MTDSTVTEYRFVPRTGAKLFVRLATVVFCLASFVGLPPSARVVAWFSGFVMAHCLKRVRRN